MMRTYGIPKKKEENEDDTRPIRHGALHVPESYPGGGGNPSNVPIKDEDETDADCAGSWNEEWLSLSTAGILLRGLEG